MTARIYPDTHIASTKANFFCRLSIHIYLKPIIIWICDIQDTWIFHIHTSIESIFYKSCTLKRTIKYLLFCFLKFICIVIVYLYKSLSDTSCFRAGRTSYSYPDMLSFLYEADMWQLFCNIWPIRYPEISVHDHLHIVIAAILTVDIHIHIRFSIKLIPGHRHKCIWRSVYAITHWFLKCVLIEIRSTPIRYINLCKYIWRQTTATLHKIILIFKRCPVCFPVYDTIIQHKSHHLRSFCFIQIVYVILSNKVISCVSTILRTQHISDIVHERCKRCSSRIYIFNIVKVGKSHTGKRSDRISICHGWIPVCLRIWRIILINHSALSGAIFCIQGIVYWFPLI